MRLIIPLIVLALAVLGCGRFGIGSNGNSNSAKSNSMPADAKAVDLPSLVGKSTEEIKKIVGVEPRFETPYLAIDLPQGQLTVDTMKGEQTSIGFKVADGVFFSTPAELGNLVGIDLGALPVPSSLGEYYFYDDVKTSRGTLKRVSLHKTGSSFDQISIDFNSL